MQKIKYIILSLFMFISYMCNAQITHVTLSYYQPVKAQCNNDPLTTADGSKINLKHLKHNKIKWCAISRDLLWLFPKDKPKRVYIEGFGVYEVKDIMHKRYNHRIDILVHPKNSLQITEKRVKVKILK